MPLPDGEVVARDWVWNNVPTRTLLDNGNGTYRCATDLPTTPVFPFLTINLIDVQYPSADMSLADVYLQFDSYGARGWNATPPVLSPDIKSASIVARTLVEELRGSTQQSLTPAGTYTNDAFVYGFQILGGPRNVSEEMGWARQLVEVLMTIREA
jgi:hypothetical protein